MSEHCTCASSDFCQVHDEIERLKSELERFARLYGDEGRKNKVLLEVLSERDAELAEARKCVCVAPIFCPVCHPRLPTTPEST